MGGIRMQKKPSQGVLRAQNGTLRLLGSLNGRWGVLGGTQRPKEGFGAN